MKNDEIVWQIESRLSLDPELVKMARACELAVQYLRRCCDECDMLLITPTQVKLLRNLADLPFREL